MNKHNFLCVIYVFPKTRQKKPIVDGSSDRTGRAGGSKRDIFADVT